MPQPLMVGHVETAICLKFVKKRVQPSSVTKLIQRRFNGKRPEFFGSGARQPV